MMDMEKNNILMINELKAGYEIKSGFVSAVDHVSFSLKKGEFLGIAGESGITAVSSREPFNSTT